ncbi:MAG: 50S ribosomal protein L6 [Spirochaetaceae bacterium]|jgi:large subunit ribosomal protein L6|nr:50S ribosomal protein L6 [Spirochaetaceae bacterium]MBR3812918.1 50S ribosomal protein L6 [Spirochaetaceae bacterium]MDD6487986.1 50S ribosomal protein L6 [Spirochaetales bacterium]
MSRLGKLPVSIPAGVKISVNDNVVTVEGPKGKLSQKFDNVEIKVNGSDVEISRKDDSRVAKASHGLYRNLIKNMVTGVSAGFTKSLIINGVGYRAEVQGKMIVMNLGYSTDFIALIPEGLTVTADAQGKVTITGIDKQLVGQFAAEIRSLRKPEPYKGKGIRYEDEYIRRKVGKSGVK